MPRLWGHHRASQGHLRRVRLPPNQEVAQLSGKGPSGLHGDPGDYEGFKAPYVVVLAQLGESIRVSGLLDDPKPEGVAVNLIGKKVKLGHQGVEHIEIYLRPGVVPLFSLVD